MKKLSHAVLILILTLVLALSGCGGGSGGGGGTSQYTLNITVEGQGTVIPASGTAYPAGTVVDLTATGATGYALDHWGGTDGAAMTGNKITIDGNKNIVAVFTKLKYDLTVNVIPDGAGTVDTVINLQTKSVYGVEHGQTVQLTAKANPNYMFDHWEGDLSGNTNPTTLNIDGARTVTAVYRLLTIGMDYLGGKIAYILQPGDSWYDANVPHGLIAATADQSTGITWAIVAYQTASVPGGTGTNIGTGSANTDKIIAQNGAGSTYAAGLARAYNGGGYTDWYLPSRDELNKLYVNRAAIGGFSIAPYWSSSQYGSENAEVQDFYGGIMLYGPKSAYNGHVRAVRSF